MNKKMPNFGPLNGVNVIHATSSVAAPFCAQMMADLGAAVIWVENPSALCISRVPPAYTAKQDRRNQRSLCLDIPSAEGKEVFLGLLKDADIFIESSKGGQYEKWGLADEVLWNVNPKLVIVHISGFGQTGVEEYVTRGSFDPIAQAFSGYMNLNGYPDRPGIPAFPYTADYITGLYAYGAALAALNHSRQTGQGDSVDVAQFEVLIRSQGRDVAEYLNTGKLPLREGDHSQSFAGYGNYTCSDGKSVYMLILGGGVLKKSLSILGLEYGSESFPENMPSVMHGTPSGDLLEIKINEFCSTRTAEEVEMLFNSLGIPCSRVYDYEMIAADPHYKAREVFIEWETEKGEKIKGINVFPKFKKNPGKVWRGLPNVGMDNEEILNELGYSNDEIDNLYEKKILTKKDL